MVETFSAGKQADSGRGASPRMDWLEASLLALIVVAVGIELRLIFTLNLNWDEFHFLSRIYEYQRDALEYRFQTFHVHLFGWLPQVAASEIDQLGVARGVVFALGLGTRWLLYRVARRFLPRVAALFTVLCYSAHTYVLHHGSSFRFDPLCSFLVLAAIWLLIATPGGSRATMRVALAGAATALALIISLKSSIFVPTLGLALLCTQGDSAARGEVARRCGLFAISLLGCFGLLYGLHALTLTPDFEPAAFIGRVATSFLVFDLFPRADYFLQSFNRDGLAWGLLGVGTLITAAKLRTPKRRAERLLLLSFLLPLASLVAYRNAFPYFYVLILAPALVLAGVPIASLFARLGNDDLRARTITAALALTVFSGGLYFGWENRNDQTLAQRQHVDLIHELFPYPVPYIDRCAMISSYPKAGMFMSRWGLADYRAAGAPVMREVIATQRPVFLLANAAGLTAALSTRGGTAPAGHRLLAADARVLRENYVWHWGILFVAGKTFALAPSSGEHSFQMLIPGAYTVESTAPVLLDGVRRQPGSSVFLDVGAHTLAVVQRDRITLRFGARLSRPTEPALHERIFRGFTYR